MLYIGLELASVCPLKCDFCPQGRGIIQRRNKFILEETIETFINLYNNSTYRPFINIGGIGEPLAHPKAENIIYYIKDKTNSKIGITTNGVFLNRLKDPELFFEKLDAIVIDLKTLQKELYQRFIRVDTTIMEKTLRNLEWFLNINKNKDKKIEIRLLDLPGTNYNLINKFILNLFNKYENIIIRVHSLMNWARKEFDMYSKIKVINKKLDKKCSYLNNVLFIDSDGNIGTCTVSLSFNKRIGNIANFNSIEEIINSDKYKKFIKYLTNNICIKCTDKYLVPALIEFEEKTNRKLRL